MHWPSLSSFGLTSVAAGLAAFAIILLLRPDLVEDRRPVVEVRQGESGHRPADLAPLGNGPVSYAQAVAKAAPAVVNVYSAKLVTRHPTPLPEPLQRHFFGDARQRLQTSLGSGVIVSPQGYILTNYHVIQDASQISIALADRRFVEATVVGNDPETDLTVLRVPLSELPAVTLANEGGPRVGDVVLAIGNPLGVGQTVTMGIVSATGRDQLGLSTFENFIQTDAAINEGNSGGALINARGELIGINTAILSRSGGSQGIGFAIPIEMARDVMRQIIEHGQVARGWLGIEAQDLDADLAEALGHPGIQGVVIASVLPKSPAEGAGLRRGDVITRIADIEVSDSRAVLNLIARHPPGARLSIRGKRGAGDLALEVTLAQRPSPAPHS